MFTTDELRDFIATDKTLVMDYASNYIKIKNAMGELIRLREENKNQIARWIALGPLEKTVALELIGGKKYTEIANELNYSIHTIRTYAHRVYRRFDINTRNELIELYAKNKYQLEAKNDTI